MAARRNLSAAKRNPKVSFRKRQSGVGHLKTDRTEISESAQTASTSFTDSTAYSVTDTQDVGDKKINNRKHALNEGKKSSKLPRVTFVLPPITATDQKKHGTTHQEQVAKEKKRPTDQEKFDKQHGFTKTDLSVVNRFLYHFSIIKSWHLSDWLAFLKLRVPIVSWLPSYNWKENFLSDLIGAVMVSILYVPEGLAYGLMIGVSPVVGVYSGIIGPLTYVIFGTSRHASTGVTAIIALMTAAVVEQMELREGADHHGHSLNRTSLCCSKQLMPFTPEYALRISSLLAFYIGVVQIVLGMLNAGILAVWLSDQLVEGLTTGAAVHVIASQIGTMTGVENVPRTSDSFGIIKFLVCFIKNAHTIKLRIALCSAICCFCLIISKTVIDPLITHWMKIKFPMESFLVIFSTLLSYLSAGTQYDLELDIAGIVDEDLPAPFVPDFRYSSSVIGPAFTIAIVSFVIHIALAKLVGKEMNYQVNANQEWLALGAMHLAASCFGCIPGGSSLTRTFTNASLRTKSQLSTVIVVLILFVVMTAIAPLFKHLPKAVLACIVVVALKDLMVKIYYSHLLLVQSAVDFLIYAVTFLSIVLISLNIGLAIGVVFALLTVVLRSQWAESTLLGRIPGTSDFKGIGHYRAASEIPGVKVFRFDAPLYFANAELFLTRMYSATGIDPLSVVNKLDEQRKAGQMEEEHQRTAKIGMLKPKSIRAVDGAAQVELTQLTHIVVDCSSFPYIDVMGVEALARAYHEYAALNITVFFAYCKVAVRQMFQKTGFYESVPKKCLFISVSDAITQAQFEQEMLSQEHNDPNVPNNLLETTETKRGGQ